MGILRTISLGLSLLSATETLHGSTADSDLPWLQWHFAGTRAVKANPKAGKVKEIWQLPESRRLSTTITQSLAQAAEKEAFGSEASAPTVRRRIATQFVEEILTFESYGEINGTLKEHPNLSIAVQLPKARYEEWDRNIRRYLGTLGWKAPEQNPASEMPDWTAAHENPAYLTRFVKHDDWVFFSIGPDAYSRVPSWIVDKEEDRIPTLEDGKILTFSSQLEGLASWLVDVSLPMLPQVRAHMKLDDYGVRTEGTVELKQAIADPLPAWAPPKEQIFSPIIGFSGTRGLNNIIRSLPAAERLVQEGLPDQIYSWARPAPVSSNSIPVFPMYLAWPIAKEDISIANLTKSLPRIAGPGIMQSGNARLVSRPARNESILSVMPTFIQPFVKGVTNSTHGLRIAGLFPHAKLMKPAPEGLFGQLDSRDNVVYYQWEITQHRIELYKPLLRFLSFLFKKPQSSANSPGFRWLTAIESKLGNTVTIVTASEEKKLEFFRKSHFGFTGLELTLLSEWLASSSFPWIDKKLFSSWEMQQFLAAPSAPAIPQRNAKARR